MYDGSFTNEYDSVNAIAVKWVAHEPSNEGAVWFKINRAKNYNDFAEAIKTYVCPGQNMIFASKSNEIALWQQAKFPARWQEQGMFLMPGYDSSYMWQGYIPQQENPHVINPADGFIQSANQRPVDSAYSYFIPGNYIVPRGVTIHERLQQMQGITPQDMMTLQNNYYSSFAADAVPLLLKYLRENELNDSEQMLLSEVKRWDFFATPDSKGTTIYQAWFDSLEKVIWNEEYARVKLRFANHLMLT